MSDKRLYWAAEPKEQDLAKKAMEFVDRWATMTGANSKGVSSTWARNIISYYSTILDPQSWESSLSFMGEQGELVKMGVPQARSLIRQLVSLVSKQRLSFQCVASQGGDDMDTLTAQRVGNALTDAIVEREHCDVKGELVAEHCAVLGTGFLAAKWRTDKGYPYLVTKDEKEQEQLHYTGDLEITTPTVYDVIYDTNKTTFSELDWVIIRTIKNRWDLIAQHPDLEDEILALPNCRELSQQGGNYFFMSGGTNEDSVFTYEFYHVPTPALPLGRMSMFSSSECIYHDGENLYECLPIEPVRAEPIMGTGFGYPILSNLLPAQEMFDHCLSAIATNQAATAVQSYMAPRGSELSAMDIGGMNFLLYSPQSATGGGKPEALQLTQSAPETFKFADLLHSHMEQISNINGALRGNPPPGVTAGKALNALTMNSMEFLESFRKAYAYGWERLMGKSLQFYAKFATVPMMMEVLGPNNKSELMSFCGKDLQAVKRVKIKQQSAILSTIGGRTEIAELLLQNGMIKDAQQFLSLVEGSSLESTIEVELSENDLLTREKQMLLEDKEPPIHECHNHPNHVRHHAALFNDPQVTGNKGMSDKIFAHIQAHMQLDAQMDPTLKAMTRTGVAPQPPAPPPMGGPMPPPPGQGPPSAHGAPPPHRAPPSGPHGHAPSNPGLLLQSSQPALLERQNLSRKGEI